MIKFPSIDQFRSTIRAVHNRAKYVGKDADGKAIFDPTKLLPTLKFRGSVKLHGTNAAVVKHLPSGDLTFQSRERDLTADEDNAGFYEYMDTIRETISDICMNFVSYASRPVVAVAVYGEWCGGSIQKGVAISGLPKMFVIYAVRFLYGEDDMEWMDLEKCAHVDVPAANIYNILKFPVYNVTIDFKQPELIQNKLIEITTAVEAECPVGKYFNSIGTGEGVVWTCVDENWTSSDFWFKVKGEKHSPSKVKTLASIDVEALQAMSDFVDYAVTEQRLEQGLQNLLNEQLKSFDMKSMGDFIRWVFNDILKEEKDTIEASGLEEKKLGSPIANKARNWFINRLNSQGTP